MKAKTENKGQGVRIFSISDNQCIWMKAGVINFKLCESAYDCTSCAFDKAMTRKVRQKSEAFVSWREIQRGKQYEGRECRHMLTGRVQYRLCGNDYRCNVCEFDQYLDECDLAKATSAVHQKMVSGFAVADGYYYHRGHSWARVEHGGFVRVGVDDFALRLLGCPTEIRLPKVGMHLGQTEVGWSIRRQDHTADMLCPMNGMVVAANCRVSKDPAAVKKDPYGQGWLFVVDPHGLRQNLKNLLFENEVPAWLGSEAKKLEGMVMSAYGVPLAATGGEIVDDIFGNLTHLRWEELVHSFLLT